MRMYDLIEKKKRGGSLLTEEIAYMVRDVYKRQQYVVEGQEQFGYTKRAGLEEEAPYNEADDIVFFKAVSYTHLDVYKRQR